MMYIAAYDISDDDRRSHVAALLQSFGNRLQKSVFLLDVDTAQYAALVNRVEASISPDHDSFYVVPTCSRCWAGVRCLGQAHPPTPDFYWAAL